MMKRPFFLTGVIFVSILLCVLILTDAVPMLRGPMPDTSVWHWPYHLRPISRVLPAFLISGLILGLAGIWLSRSDKPWINGIALGTLSLLHLALQVSIMVADTPSPIAEPLNRTLAISTNGYFQPAAEVYANQSLRPLLRTYPEAMLQFDSEHMRTHPPGLMLGNRLLIQLFEPFPAVSNRLAAQAWQQRCTDLYLLNRPTVVASALLAAAWLPMLAAAAAVFPAYALGRRWLNARGAKLAPLMVATLPALAVFAPVPDQLFATSTLLLFLWLDIGLDRSRSRPRFWLTAAGILLGLMSFLSLGNAALVLPIVLFSAAVRLVPWDRSKFLAWFLDLALVGVASWLPWFVYLALFQVWPWEIAQAGLNQHYELVTTLRAYESWVIWNLVDTALFSGFPVVVGWVVGIVWWGRGKRDLGFWLALVFGVTVLVLNLSGSSRGEVGRLWLFLMPIWAIAAAAVWAEAGRGWQIGLLACQLSFVLAIGIAWQPIVDVIVIAQRPENGPFPDQTRSVDLTLSPKIELDHYSLNVGADAADLTLVWRAAGPSTRPYTVFNHLVDDSGQLVAQADGWPLNGQWPPTCWTAGETIIDRYQLNLAELPAGRYRLITGMYDAETGARIGEIELEEVFLDR